MGIDIEKKRARNRRYKESIKELVRIAKDVPCMDCGIKYPYYVMDLDHRPGETKLYSLNKIYTTVGSKKTVAAEIAKCDPVCANCHRIRTWERITS